MRRSQRRREQREIDLRWELAVMLERVLALVDGTDLPPHMPTLVEARQLVARTRRSWAEEEADTLTRVREQLS